MTDLQYNTTQRSTETLWPPRSQSTNQLSAPALWSLACDAWHMVVRGRRGLMKGDEHAADSWTELISTSALPLPSAPPPPR